MAIELWWSFYYKWETTKDVIMATDNMNYIHYRGEMMDIIEDYLAGDKGFIVLYKKVEVWI